MKPKLSPEARKLVKAVADLAPRIVDIQQTIHKNPELPLQEHNASELLCEFLSEQGFKVKRGVAGLPTAFRADAGEEKARPRAGLLCEYDALPGIGHACGHSVIAAASAGAAAALHRVKPRAALSVLGTPGEEVGAGKKAMVEKRTIKGVDFAMMVHPSSKRQIVRLFLGVVQRVYTFKGKAAHAAAFPDRGANALDAVVLLYNSVAALRQQLPEQARIHSIITDGGKAPNIIPERAEAFYVIRALDLSLLAELAKKVDACARGAAKSTGTRVTINKAGGLTMPMKVNRALARAYEDQVIVLGLEPFHGPEDKNIGSSDIGNLSQAVPAIHPHVPIADRPGAVTIHTREFEKAAGGPAGQRAAIEGAKLLALTALAVQQKPSLYKEIKQEFDSTRQKIPKGLA